MTNAAPGSPEFLRLARRGLVVLTMINLFNYLDRYVVAALIKSLKEPDGLSLTDFQAGSLSTSLIVVYGITSPIFASLAARASRPRVLALGVGIWSIATALGGLVGSFIGLLAVRGLVGVGEAAYGTIAPALLADYFPRARRGFVFSVFFSAIPLGTALGYVLGGFVNKHFGWRPAFYIAGLPGLALAYLALRLPDPPRGCHDDLPGGHGAVGGRVRWATYRGLIRIRSYRLAVLGYAAATFAAGGLAYWMITFLERVRGESESSATIKFGVVIAGTALTGTFLGGIVGDRLLRRTKHAYLWMSGVSTLLAAPFVLLALVLQDPTLYFGAIVVGGILLFASTGPINSAIVNAVPTEHRVPALAMSIFAIHFLGDVPSPPLIGIASDATSLGTAILMVPIAVVVAGAIWTYAAWRGERDDRERAA